MMNWSAVRDAMMMRMWLGYDKKPRDEVSLYNQGDRRPIQLLR